jgi:hypothetical protein
MDEPANDRLVRLVESVTGRDVPQPQRLMNFVRGRFPDCRPEALTSEAVREIALEAERAGVLCEAPPPEHA